ncbi:MAG TPA: DUF5694 domain-containing protein [Terriglobales bacterium]|nr:DUF5694 domain-containing protein [Terriglobales bacterium]
MRTSTRTILLAAAFAFAILCAVAQNPSSPGPTPKAHVLVLGTFHMANPGRDVFNLQVDDMKAPKRQAEIAAFVENLKTFRPTKIAVEAPLGDDKTNQHYRDYLAGKYELTANEVDQVAFRLAKEMGLKQVYPIDIMGDFPYEAVADFAKKNGKEQLMNDIVSVAPRELEKESNILKNGTVTDLFLHINAEEQVREGNALYMGMARFAGNGEYPGPDLMAAWYRRNARIFANLRNLMDSPDDRVLVIYGAGHAYWLQRNVLDSDDLALEKLADYVH